MKKQFLYVALTALLISLGPHATYAQTTSNFVSVKLPRDVELEIPKGWWLIGDDYNQLIETSVEAALDLAGIELQGGQRVNLIAANSMPPSTYAAVRIDATTPPSATPSELELLSADDVRELQGIMRDNLQRIVIFQGNKLIEFLGTRIEKISGHPALVSEYRRTGPKGPVFVQINTVFTSTQEISFNLSYRESEAGLWKAVIGKIRQSIIIE